MNKFLLVLLISCGSVSGQTPARMERPVQTVDRIFRSYIKYAESTDSQDNKDAMANAFKLLQVANHKNDLRILINVWMYYDPTDFPTRTFIEPILNKDRTATLIAIDKRLKKKRKGENKETAPYADLILLREKFIERL